MKKIKYTYLVSGLMAMAVAMVGCSSETKTAGDSGTTVAANTAKTDAVTPNPAPDATKPSDPVAEPAATTKPAEPAKEKANQTPPAKTPSPTPKDNDEKELMTTNPPKPVRETTKPPVQTPNREAEVPAVRVAPSGNAAKYVGVFTMDDPKLEAVNKKLREKKKPPIVFEIEIKPDGTYEFRQGTEMKSKTIEGTVQASDTKVTLSPYKVNGKPAVARGDKVAFNFLLSSDGKKLLTIANTSTGKTNLNFKRIK